MDIKSSPEASEYTLEQQEDVRLLANETGVTLIGTVSGRLIHVLTDIWLARIFGPASFGIYSIGWNLHRLLFSLISLGIPNGTIFLGVKYWKKESNRLNAVFQTGTLTLITSGIITAVAALLSADWLAGVVFNKPEAALVIRTVGLVMPFYLVMANASAMTRITRRMKYSVLSNEIVSTVSMLVIFAVLYWITGQLWAIFVSMVLSYALAGAVAIIFVSRLFPEQKRITKEQIVPALRELLGFSIPTMLAGVFGASDLWLNRVLAGIFFPAEKVGLYQAASQFNNLFGILLASVVAAFMPIIANLHQSGGESGKQRLNELYKVTTKWSLYINLPVVLVTLLLPGDVMHFFYGAKYSQGAGLLVILTIGQLINVGTGATSGLFLMTGRQRNYMYLTISSFILNIFGSIILIPSLGIYAMAVGQLLSSLCDNILGTIWLARDTGMWPYDLRYFKGFFASLATAAVIWWTPTWYAPPMAALIIRSGLGLAVFIAALWVLGIDREDHEILDVLSGRLRRLLSTLTGFWSKY